jgi:hypothetical protein
MYGSVGVATTLKTRGASVCLFINNLKTNNYEKFIPVANR